MKSEENGITDQPLFLNEPSKTKEALSTFELLSDCTYGNKQLGSSGQLEVITCDCVKDINDGENLACGEDSDCINRLTSVECVNGSHSSCGNDCRNQRFQRKQYAKITIFQTEKKGYGVRADANINQGDFIYEYIGEVIAERYFRKRMLQYDAEGVKHFYFMMLQKDEFIDATKKGTLARFCNHSCSPNAFVDKWVVGTKLRMGIFAKRDIVKGEEICFDYNVDRYGAVAQPCYCGQANCIGFLGGKTQTDSASLLPQSLADALSITSVEEKEWLRAKRKVDKKFKVKNNESNINEEFINSIELKPLEDSEVPRVMGALMLPNQESLIVEKLIERIHISEDSQEINRLLIRMHGYKTFSTIIKEAWKNHLGTTLLKMLDILLRWPAMSKNKITSSQIEGVIENIDSGSAKLAADDNIYSDINVKTQELLGVWDKLQMAYRIRRASDLNGAGVPVITINRRNAEEQTQKEEHDTPKAKPAAPKAFQKNEVERNKKRDELRRLKYQQEVEREKKRLEEEYQKNLSEKSTSYMKIIAEAAKAAEEHQKRLQALENANKPDKQATKEAVLKQWNKLFASHVPNMLKKYDDKIGHDNLKACAKDIVKILSEKELNRNDGKLPPKEGLKKDKLKKVKLYTKEYMTKWMVKFEQKNKNASKRKAKGNGQSTKKVKT